VLFIIIFGTLSFPMLMMMMIHKYLLNRTSVRADCQVWFTEDCATMYNNFIKITKHDNDDDFVGQLQKNSILMLLRHDIILNFKNIHVA